MGWPFALHLPGQEMARSAELTITRTSLMPAMTTVRTPTTVRLQRVLTLNGRVHALMALRLDAHACPAPDFAALNRSRWRIETSEVKRRLPAMRRGALKK